MINNVYGFGSFPFKGSNKRIPAMEIVFQIATMTEYRLTPAGYQVDGLMRSRCFS